MWCASGIPWGPGGGFPCRLNGHRRLRRRRVDLAEEAVAQVLGWVLVEWSLEGEVADGRGDVQAVVVGGLHHGGEGRPVGLGGKSRIGLIGDGAPPFGRINLSCGAGRGLDLLQVTQCVSRCFAGIGGPATHVR